MLCSCGTASQLNLPLILLRPWKRQFAMIVRNWDKCRPSAVVLSLFRVCWPSCLYTLYLILQMSLQLFLECRWVSERSACASLRLWVSVLKMVIGSSRSISDLVFALHPTPTVIFSNYLCSVSTETRSKSSCKCSAVA